MGIAYDRGWIAGLCVVAAVLPGACFLDASGIAPGAGGAGTGGASSTTSSTSSTTSSTSSTSSTSTSGGMDGGPDGDAGTCGNGAIDPGEDCDGAHLNGATCASLGHPAGTLGCTASCKYDTSACVGFPTNWYDQSWAHRRAITINHAKVAGDLVDFPVAITVTDAGLLGQLQAGAADVLVASADGKTKLAHEIEIFDKAAGTLVIWVRVPVLSSTADTTLYLYYANPTSSNQANPAGVWDAHDQVVLHLGEPATAGGTGTTFVDSTGNGHSGAQHGTANGSGQVGRAQVFDGSSQYIDLAGPDGVVIGTGGCTVSAWIKTFASNSAALLTKAQGTTNVPNDKVVLVNGAHQLGVDSYNVASQHSAATVTDGQWHQVAWTQTPSSAMAAQWDLYVDGVHDGSLMVSPSSDSAGHTVRIGSQISSSGYNVGFFPGSVDELRVADTPRSAAWIQTSFNNQGNPGAFYTISAEQP